jgi:hypothetical protein
MGGEICLPVLPPMAKFAAPDASKMRTFEQNLQENAKIDRMTILSVEHIYLRHSPYHLRSDSSFFLPSWTIAQPLITQTVAGMR